MNLKIFLSTLDYWLIFGGSFILLLGILFVVFYLLFGFRKNRTPKIAHITVDEAFLDNLLVSLGKTENIEKIAVENGRVKFTVIDLKKVNYDSLKTLATSGVFVVNNNIKLLFKYDSKEVVEGLKSKGVKE